jgi:pimeloyl-ACP methyl ester carboxylesterase
VAATGRLRYLDARPSPAARPRGTLLLLHAFPLNARMWERQLSRFAERGWHVVAPHFRGLGSDSGDGSPGSEARDLPSIDDYAGDVIDLLDGLHAHEAVVVGLSLGGYVALAMLRLAPRYIQALVLADTKPQADTAEGAANRQRMIDLVRERGVDAIADELVPKLLGDTTRHNQPDIAELVRAIARENSVDSIARALAVMMTRPDSTPLLAAIHVPVHVIVGAEDTLTPPALSEAMQRDIAGATLTIVPNAGHLSNLENADRFDEALAEFLDHRV